jgi:elongator complex protein 4
MSFQKRSVPLSSASETKPVRSLPGVRISPQFGHPTTSTGTSSLDTLLGLGAGLALGTSLIIQENGTTDHAGALLRCFAAEGVMQGHAVFVGADKSWGANLPGLAEEPSAKGQESVAVSEKMKIAWRYERLSVVGGDSEKRGASRVGPT